MLRLLIICVFLHCSIGVLAIDTLRLSIDSVDLAELTKMRNAAMQSGLILKDHKKKVPAIFSSSSTELKAKIRLKGDWLDHVDTDKWSLRIELKNGHYKSMQRFSIQHPRTRGYLTEYEIHQLFEQHGVMTTKYEFAIVFINGENKGIYAVEEHFDFPMLDRLHQRKAPILKFSESVFWEFQRMQASEWEPINIEYPVFENAEITSFRKKKIRNSVELANQFRKGRNMLHALRIGNYERLSDIVDLESFAYFYALSDLIGMHHGLRWHNLRFYADPILDKLKPIAFDVWQIESGVNRPLLGAQQENSDTIYFADGFFRDKFLNDSEFRGIYFDKLREVSASYGQLDNHQNWGINTTLRQVMTAEFPDQSLGGIVLNEAIRLDMDSIENAFRPFVFNSYSKWKKAHPQETKKHARPIPNQPVNGLGLKAYFEHVESGKQLITIINKHISALEIVGFSSSSRSIDFQASLKPIADCPSDFLIIEIDTGLTKIVFRNPGDSVLHKSKISRYPYYVSPSHSKHKSDSTIEIRLSGNVRLDGMLNVAQHQQLIIDPGSYITFGPEGGVVCLGKFSSNGSSDYPVVFRSDSTFLGIVLAGSESGFTSTVFHGLELNKNQNLTGAVTVVDSKLSMTDCIFSKVQCEDALNGIRVDAEISGTSFSECFSDAIDLDFSNFKINNLTVINSGNDGLDVSGSSGSLTAGRFQTIGDKAISCGEESSIRIESTSINGAQTGIAAKDGSQVEVSTTSISNCDIGVWSFRKKPYYDGGTAILKDVQFQSVQIPSQVDGYSFIQE